MPVPSEYEPPAVERQGAIRTMNDLDKAFEEACKRFEGRRLSDLDEIDQILVTIWGLEADVNNGGFDQYYFNSSGDQANFAPKALRAIGAERIAAIVTQANAVFGPDGPSSDRNARQAQLFLVAPPKSEAPGPWEALDSAFYAYPDDIAKLLEAYLRAKGRMTGR
jgi:Domain of unknown function (DUF4375)